MDTNTMISDLESNGKVSLPLAMIGDLMDIDKRIKYGDESGWRGDPTMCIVFNKPIKQFEVWGIDNHGNQYMAASDHVLGINLVRKLAAGDYQKHDVIQEVLDHTTKMQAAADQEKHEKFREVGEKMQWAIRREFAGHLGGRGGIHAIPGKAT